MIVIWTVVFYYCEICLINVFTLQSLFLHPWYFSYSWLTCGCMCLLCVYYRKTNTHKCPLPLVLWRTKCVVLRACSCPLGVLLCGATSSLALTVLSERVVLHFPLVLQVFPCPWALDHLSVGPADESSHLQTKGRKPHAEMWFLAEKDGGKKWFPCRGPGYIQDWLAYHCVWVMYVMYW